jgi:hypothetical protein
MCDVMCAVELKGSCIVADGALTPAFEYIQALRARQERAARKEQASAAAAATAATTTSTSASGSAPAPSSAAAPAAAAPRAPAPGESMAAKYPVTVSVMLEGHLFDSGFINQVLGWVDR